MVLTSEEKAYIAGIIDGEGSIMLIKFHNNQFPSPRISISSTSIELLEWIRSKTNAGIILNKKNYNKQKHKNSYTYTIRYNNALTLLEEIEAYLVTNVKKKRAQYILNEYKKVTPRNGRYSKDLLRIKEIFYENFLNLQ